jgi:phospholipase/carboxylesterase
MPAILPHITLETAPSPRFSIIWLHGLGADGGDFVPIAEEMSLPAAVRYIFPHAPKRPVTINGGFIMRAWYDLSESDLATGDEAGAIIKQDVSGIHVSQTEIEKLIAQELQRGIPLRHIFLAGFSQGGVVALQTGLRHTGQLGGILALSTYLASAETLNEDASAASKNTPIFMAHGRNDPIVPYALGNSSREILLQQGYQVDWHEYAMQHSVCQEEVRDIEAWLTAVISRQTLVVS